MLYRNRKVLVYGLLSAVAACIVLGFWRPMGSAGNWFNSAGLLLDILGLVLLEASGIFEKLSNFLLEADAQGEPLPSNVVREVIDNPEPDWPDHLNERLFRDVRTGVQMIVGGCLLQLLGTWL